MGTVMGWVDKKGVRHQTLVLDASYRNCHYCYGNGTPSGNPSGAVSHEANPFYYAGTSFSTTTDQDFSVADSVINSRMPIEDTYTSKYNTDRWIATGASTWGSTNATAGWCRSKTVNIKGVICKCDVPNLQILVRIHNSMHLFDKLDPTPNGNKYLFTKQRSGLSVHWNFGSSHSNANSSTWRRAGDIYTNIWDVINTGLCGSTDNGHNGTFNQRGTIPILELENL